MSFQFATFYINNYGISKRIPIKSISLTQQHLYSNIEWHDILSLIFMVYYMAA